MLATPALPRVCLWWLGVCLCEARCRNGPSSEGLLMEATDTEVISVKWVFKEKSKQSSNSKDFSKRLFVKGILQILKKGVHVD